jgi:hypothetical protein
MNRLPIVFAACLVALPPPLFAGDPPSTVATVTRTVKQVDLQSNGAAWREARKGDPLLAGDVVRTGDAALAIVKFMDNTLLQIRANSTVGVTGELRNRTISKEVNLNSGGVGFTVPKQRPGEEFRFTSPTSVASIRGTSGYYACSDSSDTLTVLEGTILFMNRHSNREVMVEAGYTAVTGGNGSMEQAPSTDQQRNSAEGALTSGEKKKQLEIDLRNGSGKSRKLRIDYKD